MIFFSMLKKNNDYFAQKPDVLFLLHLSIHSDKHSIIYLWIEYFMIPASIASIMISLLNLRTTTKNPLKNIIYTKSNSSSSHLQINFLF